jgi:hypothetical protein
MSRFSRVALVALLGVMAIIVLDRVGVSPNKLAWVTVVAALTAAIVGREKRAWRNKTKNIRREAKLWENAAKRNFASNSSRLFGTEWAAVILLSWDLQGLLFIFALGKMKPNYMFKPTPELSLRLLWLGGRRGLTWR